MKKELTAKETKEKALRFLEYRSHSEKELSDKLKRAGAREEDIPPVMDFLKEYGFIKDDEYAKHLARDLQNLKKYGKHRIIQELKFRGIIAEYIDDAMAELEDDERDSLYPLVEKKLAANFDRKNIEKVVRYFVYRGYGYEDIKSCIEEIKENSDEE